MPTQDYAVYLPTGNSIDAWGIAVSAAGHTHVRPGTSYPPGRHPMNHALTWDRGRLLSKHQLVYISQGSGRFESTASGFRKISAGSVFLLFPGIWHRYQPHPKEGWVEDWIELTGPTMNRLMRKAVLSPERSVYRIGVQTEILELFDQCHSLARSVRPSHPSVLGAVGLRILAQVLFRTSKVKTKPSANEVAIHRSVTLIRTSIDRPLHMSRIADAVGMSYSHFRRMFRKQMSVSPKQYYLQLRLRKVQELLVNSSDSIKEIATVLGFDSAFHLSADFKRRTGLAPIQWRKRSAGRA